MGNDSTRRVRTRHPRRLSLLLGVVLLVGLLPATAAVADEDPDPRIGLGTGIFDAGEAISNLDKVATWQKSSGTFFNPASPGSSSFWVSDLAFQGDVLALGNFWGMQLFDNSDAEDPTLLTEIVCPGGQGDPTLYGNLLFRSVEGNNSRLDCGTEGNSGETAAQTRFRGIQIFDISDLDSPVQVGGVQLCRGSHTHTLVEAVDDPDHVYIYNSGTSSVSNSGENTHCNNGAADTENPSRWMTEVIKVPVNAPEDAAVVSENRLFIDPDTGAVNGLGNVNHCHDITAYPELGLAAGACQGRGLLIDISDPEAPVRLDAVADSNFSYWHSATWNNDGTKVVFTDEWGGGTGARCREGDPMEWGANAIFDVVETEDGPRLDFQSYYKLPVVQTSQENCVAHNGTLVPVPGRDILVQAWYQGGLSIFDFTDSANPTEIAFFDRGPFGATLMTAGFWSAYWHNGNIFASEIGRGLDVFALTESEHISAAEIAAAGEISFHRTNAQAQVGYGWGPSLNVIGAHRDQGVRSGDITNKEVLRIDAFLAAAEAATAPQQLRNAAIQGEKVVDFLGDDPARHNLVNSLLLVTEDLRQRALDL